MPVEAIATIRPDRERQYYSLVAAGFASNVGTIMLTTVVGWSLIEQTGQSGLAALAQAAYLCPAFLFALITGALADTYNRRALQMLSQAGILFASALIVLLLLGGSGSPSYLLTSLFILGTAAALRAPAWQASVADLIVDGRKRISAFSINAALFSISRVVGAIAFGILGSFKPAIVSSVAVLLAAPLLIILQKTPAWQSPLQENSGILGNLRTGLVSFAHSERRTILIDVFGAAFWSSAVIALLPAVAIYLSEQDSRLLYTILFLSFGMGALIAIYFASLLQRSHPPQKMVCYGLVITSLALIVFAQSDVVAIAILAAWFTGLANTFIFSSTTILLQRGAAGKMIGMGFAGYQVCLHGGTVLGSLSWGLITQYCGVETALLSAGVGALLSTAAIVIRFNLIR